MAFVVAPAPGGIATGKVDECLPRQALRQAGSEGRQIAEWQMEDLRVTRSMTFRLNGCVLVFGIGDMHLFVPGHFRGREARYDVQIEVITGCDKGDRDDNLG